MFRLTTALAALLLVVSSLASAEAELSIRFYDKRIYYPESEIAIKVTIANTGAEVYRFKLAEDKVHSLSFEARTASNRALDAAETFKRAAVESGPVYYREIAVEPGEEFSFVERLERYVAFTEAGTYAVRANFWPELAPQGGASPEKPLSSNTLLLSLRPSPAGISPAADTIQSETGEILRPEPISPDEVVRRTIVARQQSRWNEFFLYLDVEALLLRNEDQKRIYDRESDEGRRRMLEKYRADLRENLVDKDIVTLPVEFSILETRYSAAQGEVRTLQKFDYRSFKMVKEYDYELRRRDDVWYIVGYSVLNKGTE